MNQPVVVFEGASEFEAQAARDILQAAGVPVIHIPDYGTGIFGVPRHTRVAVPPDAVGPALAALEAAGMPGRVTDRPRGVAGLQDAVSRGLPVAGLPPLRGGGLLGKVLLGLALLLAGLIFWALAVRQ